MDTITEQEYLLTDQERERVLRFISEQLENPLIYYRMWLEGYRSLFDPDTYMPMQIVKFYVLSGREIIEYSYACDTQITSLNDFKNRIIHDGCKGNVAQFIGPWVPADSSIKEMAAIIKIYEDIQYAKHRSLPRLSKKPIEPQVSNLI